MFASLNAYLTAGGAGPSDPYFYDVSLLLSGDGTNGAQNNTFLDSSTNNFTITRNGNTTQGSFSPYGNLWSNYFNGSDAFLTAPASSNWTIGGSSTFSVETWVCVTNTSAQSALCGALNRWWLGSNFTDVSGASGKFCFAVFNGSSWQTISSATSVVAGQWYHVAATFSSGTTKIYVNGNLESSTTGVSTNSYSGSLFMGAILNPGYSYGLTGYLSNIRITNGGSLPYTANFTPSTVPLTATSNTVFLTSQNNRFIDNSTNAYTISITGSPSVQRFSPFNPTSTYSTSVIDGSGYFDGAGDYLTSNATTALNFGTGDFTIEFWAYLSSNSIYQDLFGDQNTSGGVGISLYNGVVFYGNQGISNPLSASYSGNYNQWTHVAVSRSSGTSRMFFNGVLVSSSSDSINYSSSTGITIGKFNSRDYPANGYLSNIRVVKGTAVYTAAFTPPTAPVTAITNTSLLCNMTNAGIPDLAMQNDLETVGSAQVSTSVKKYGTGSLYFDGSSQLNYLSPVFGSGDFTVEGWVYFNSTSGNQAIFGINFNSNANSLSAVRVDISSGVFRFMGSTDGSNFYFFQATSTAPSTSTWYHIALVRSSGTVTFYVNGTSAGSVSSVPNTLYAGTGGSRIGNIVYSSNYYLNGYVDDFRITNGYARYTTNFTPPTTALPTY